MRRLLATYFRANASLSAPGIRYPKGCVAVIPYPEDPRAQQQILEHPAIRTANLSDYFIEFDYDSRAPEANYQIFTHLGGGIGDVIAFSAVASFLRNYPLTVHLSPDHIPVVEWFDRRNIVYKHFWEPVVLSYGPHERLTRYRNLRRLRLEFAVHENLTINWYDAFYQRIGARSVPVEYYRPHLRSDRLPQYERIIHGDGSVLIAPRSSCQMRTSRFEDFYEPVRDAFPSHTIYVHDRDLTNDDRVFLDTVARDVKVIGRVSLGQSLANMWDVGYVVSTDTAACHFREGIKKPFLSVYGAFKYEERTQHYLWGRSFNTRSECPIKPCHIHEEEKGQRCPEAKRLIRDLGVRDITYAPCQSGDEFKNQLFNELTKAK